MSVISRYQRRISGPLMDRIDLHVEVPRVDYEKLSSDRLGEPSDNIRARVERAREVQMRRFTDTNLVTNADMGPKEVRQYCQLDDASRALIKSAMQQLGLSARAFHRILKVSRTIADLAGAKAIQTAHVAEALQYRQRRQM
jgi:magnesium chelatase family protein